MLFIPYDCCCCCCCCCGWCLLFISNELLDDWIALTWTSAIIILLAVSPWQPYYLQVLGHIMLVFGIHRLYCSDQQPSLAPFSFPFYLLIYLQTSSINVDTALLLFWIARFAATVAFAATLDTWNKWSRCEYVSWKRHSLVQFYCVYVCVSYTFLISSWFASSSCVHWWFSIWASVSGVNIGGDPQWSSRFWIISVIRSSAIAFESVDMMLLLLDLLFNNDGLGGLSWLFGKLKYMMK